MKKLNNKHGIVENIGAAMALLGIERHVIRAAKKAACPAFLQGSRIDVDALEEWLEEKETSKTGSGRLLPPPEPLPDLRTIEQSLAGAIEVEAEALGAVRAARARGDFAAVRELTASHGLAQRNRREAEKTITELKVRRGELLDKFQHEAQLRRLWYPMVTGLRTLPRKLAAREMPADESGRERLIDEEIEALIAGMKRSLRGDADPVFHLNTYFAVMLKEKNKAEILAHIDEIRKMAESIEG